MDGCCARHWHLACFVLRMAVSNPLQFFIAGVVATGAMFAVSKASRSMVMPELTKLAGTMVAPPRSGVVGATGVVAQLVNGGVFAQAYRLVLDTRPSRQPWRRGLAIGLMHGAGAGLFLALVPRVHPRVPEQVAPPGAFMLNHGAGPAAVLVGLHGLYGAIVACLTGRRGQSERNRLAIA